MLKCLTIPCAACNIHRKNKINAWCCVHHISKALILKEKTVFEYKPQPDTHTHTHYIRSSLCWEHHYLMSAMINISTIQTKNKNEKNNAQKDIREKFGIWEKKCNQWLLITANFEWKHIHKENEREKNTFIYCPRTHQFNAIILHPYKTVSWYDLLLT